MSSRTTALQIGNTISEIHAKLDAKFYMGLVANAEIIIVFLQPLKELSCGHVFENNTPKIVL